MDSSVYIVIELQIDKDGNVANLVNAYTNVNEAESKYHSVLASAAVSNVYRHSASILDDRGVTIKSESFRHTVVAESEGE